MHENHLSLQETAFHFNLGHHDIVNRWERIYYEEGPQALYEERRGRRKNMSSKPREKKLSKKNEENDTINAHGFNDKKVTKEISNVAKSWYIKNCFTF